MVLSLGSTSSKAHLYVAHKQLHVTVRLRTSENPFIANISTGRGKGEVMFASLQNFFSDSRSVEKFILKGRYESQEKARRTAKNILYSGP